MKSYDEELEAENIALRKQLDEEEGERWNLARRLEIATLEAEKMSTLEVKLAAKDARIAALEMDIEGLRIVAEGLAWAKKRNEELEAENAALRVPGLLTTIHSSSRHRVQAQQSTQQPDAEI